jgi:predicted N-formylglutamate amidohydrolase
MPDTAFLVSCEHAVNHVPTPWKHLFADHEEILASHRAYDPGALKLARLLADTLDAPCFEAEVTRLLIDHNRSPENRFLWSKFSRGLTKAEKNSLIDEYYLPFRNTVGQWIEKQRKNGLTVIHLSIHSFTPVLEGRVRRADIGLLYDPRRVGERYFARSWKKRLLKLAPDLRVRLNYPYRGVSDGHQRTYRLLYGSTDYFALELEINQALVRGDVSRWSSIQNLLTESVREKLM